MKPSSAQRPLRVVQLCAVDFTVKQFLLPLGEALRTAGYEVSFACTPGTYTPAIEARGFRFLPNPISRSGNVLHHARSLYRTWKLLRHEKPDVVHVHTPIAALLGRIAARLAGVPRIVYTAHGFYFHDQMKPWLRNTLVQLEKMGAAYGDYILTVSAEDQASAIQLGIAPPDRIETIYNGVDAAKRFNPEQYDAKSRLQIRERLGIPADAYVVGIVGRLVREKGFFELFDAAGQLVRNYPHLRILVVGDVLPSDYDGSKREVQDRIQALGLQDHVAFAGMVDDTAPYLAAMDAFTLPSYREGMPVSLLEAMAMALPAVATDVRGCREEVVHGETGWIVPAKDAQALANRVEWFLQHPQQAGEMGSLGRQRVLDKFTLPKVLAHQLEVYERLTRNLPAQ